MEKKKRLIIGIIITLIGCILTFSLLFGFYSLGYLYARTSILPDPPLEMENYVGLTIYSMLLIITGYLFIVHSPKFSLLTEFILIGVVLEMLFWINQNDYYFFAYFCLFIFATSYISIHYQRIETNHRLFFKQTGVIVLINMILMIIEHGWLSDYLRYIALYT